MGVKTASQKIREAREAKGYSRLQTALRIGVSYMTLYMWENGVTKEIKPENKRKLEELLGVKL